MKQKTLSKLLALMLVGTLVLVISCASTSNMNKGPTTSAGSAANPKTAEKKQTGGS